MRRRASLLGLAALPLCVRAQPVKPARIAWIAGVHFDAFTHRGVYVEAMRERGWIEGLHYVVESFSHEGRAERIPALAAELVRRQPELILASGTLSVGPVMQATRTLPIVFMGVGDPVGSGFVASLARPGGNATGVGGLSDGLSGKFIELLKQAAPQAQRQAVAYNPDFAFHVRALLPQYELAAQRLGVSLVKVALRGPDDLEAAFKAIVRARATAVGFAAQPWQQPHGARLAALCLQHRLPAITIFDDVARAGVLMAYGWRLVDMVRRVPGFIDRILRQGAAPGELPVEQPTHFYLTLNLKTASALGLTVAPALRLRADEVIE
jgi:putative ABC transport system substrate-binding protein